MIPNRGIPSKFSFYLPPHYSDEIRSFQDDSETPTRNLWSLDEILNFIFPKKYQSKYHEIALSFLNLLGKKLELSGDEIGSFIRDNKISKATFYNRVLPKLKRFGFIKVRREAGVQDGKKFRKMRISISKTFGNYLMKIADSWLAFVDDVRTRKKE